MGEPTRFFFVHVMKTGGTSFVEQQLKPAFGVDGVFPGPGDGPAYDLVESPYWRLAALDEMSEDRRAAVRAYAGHYPLCARERMGEPVITLTLLRDPVERTISYLKHCRTYHPFHAELSLEEIYDDEPWHLRFMLDFQTKMFALRPGEVTHVSNPVPMDATRLADAKKALTTVDLLGVHHRYDEFVTEAAARFGLPGSTGVRMRQSRPTDVSDTLRRRIADDNRLDLELFAFGDELVRQRAA